MYSEYSISDPAYDTLTLKSVPNLRSSSRSCDLCWTVETMKRQRRTFIG